MFGSVCWGGNISKLDSWRLEKIVVKKEGKGRSCCAKAIGKFWDTLWKKKRAVKKKKADVSIKWPYTASGTLPWWQTKQRTHTVIKPGFYPRLCQLLMKIITGFKPLCTCDRAGVNKVLRSVEKSFDFLHFVFPPSLCTGSALLSNGLQIIIKYPLDSKAVALNANEIGAVVWHLHVLHGTWESFLFSFFTIVLLFRS